MTRRRRRCRNVCRTSDPSRPCTVHQPAGDLPINKYINLSINEKACGVVRRLWTTQLFTYLLTDSATRRALVYISRNDRFATFSGRGHPKMGPIAMKFELGRDFLARSAKWPNGLCILPSVISSFFYYEQSHLSIYWTDFHDLYTKWKVFA